jgi:hypothetical protein
MKDNQEISPISVSAELTESGVKASILSRAMSAWDRYWGAKADQRRAPLDAEIAEGNAVSSARVKIIEALGDLGVERLKSDPNFAARAIDNFLPSLLRKQENRDAVLDLAAEDLRQNPGSEEEASTGPEKLSDNFLNRFERFAEDATADEVRERWAKVLASEIRRPGTFSAKVMRVIDELDQPTAALFEQLCTNRLGEILPKPIAPELTFSQAAALTGAGLIVEPGLGQNSVSTRTTDGSGKSFWFWGWGQYGVAAAATDAVPRAGVALEFDDGKPVIPVFVLTDVGVAIASILPSDPAAQIAALSAKVAEALPGSEVRVYSRRLDADQWTVIQTIKPTPSATAD